MRRLVRWGGGALAGFLALTAVVHVPAVQRMMGWTDHHGTGACPFGYGSTTTAAAVPRVKPSADLRLPLAHARPALGFALDHTTREQVMQWATLHGVACAIRHAGTEIECTGVPGALLGASGPTLAATSTWFEIDAAGKLRSIKTVRRDANVAAVASAFDEVTAAVSAQAGKPAQTVGSASPEVLASGALRQATVAYRFRDYRATIRATNLADGFVLTEAYTSLD